VRGSQKTAALVQVGVLVAIGSPAVFLEWDTTRALAAGAIEEEITGVLLAIARWPGSAASSPPLPTWPSDSGMTSRPH
jgi:alkylhydroperoxidase/carboxymuconolactone decarboxylase family protein YurZ